MTYFKDRSETDLRRGYGYGHLNILYFELTPLRYKQLETQGWQRPFEIIHYKSSSSQDCECQGCMMSESEIAFFNSGARGGFKYIAQRHGLSPSEMWELVESGMRKLGIHLDDLEDLQNYCFGWLELTPEAMHRWCLRYPQRCPLLDVLCSLDSTCEQLNAVQDWLLSSKGVYGRTRNDVLPALPEPDGIRPDISLPIPCNT